MSASLAISLDAMGGDNAPDMVVRGAEIARQRFPDVHFLLFGDEARLQPLLRELPELAKVSTIRHTDIVVAMDDKPSQALRAGRGSSMRLAIDAVQDGEAAAVVSAGNTGALMAMAKFVLKTMPGIDRPAIASFFPTMRSESVMLDLGANVQCDANNLVQFAVMGNVFARAVLGVQQPSMGILNVGAEELKGHDAVKVAASMLRDVPLPGRFVGFVEGDDIAKGTVDVVVTDGFTGNIALKTIEGTVKLYGHWLKQTFSMSIWSKLAYLFARPALNGLRAQVDPRRYNGAILMGLNGICVKSHGGTDSFGFANAIGVAVNMVQNDAMERMRQDLAQLMAVPGGEAMAAAL
ncbi:phosphate:acyl-[acyl carrier protein] acyltransferase [Dongia mobilis]|uniref:Phosphate acyltransferase n=1 Tax=Dongia mobilis TaxID=578943 RepID=A0A4V3DEE5_9PROT|nr:phosphate acyltransferase PlsX [Dongia mobilis]TDQ80932.1 phosphate:acyl-[acyl carrier protein] acyltransferase [Dongia mobilis]